MKLSSRQPARLAWFALLIAAGAMLLSASGAQAASKRGVVLVKDIRPGPRDSITEPEFCCGEISYAGGYLTNVRGTLYFSADDGTHGYELWRSDGTRNGTRMVKDINPGPDGGDWGWFTGVNGIGYFSAFDGTNGGLWRSDGTEAGTSLVKGFGPPPGIFHLIDVSGTLYFGVTDGSQTALWRSDDTEAGTGVVKQGLVGDFEVTDFRGTLYIAADDSVLGPTLWRSDGTVPGTVMVRDFDRYPPCCFTDLHDTLYFLRSNGTTGGSGPNELWRSNGTGARTALVKRAKVAFSEPTVFKGKLYLGDHRALWRSDGTRRGTKVIRGFPGYRPRSLTAVKRTLYFAGADKKHGEELWRSDGTRKGTRMVWDIRHRRDIRRGDISSRPRNLTAIGKTLFFTAADGRHGEELWRAGPKPRKKGKPKRKKG
ncbi:MAG: ELWxxDGT repeat protein [Solirubrobacterales bacterium]